MRALVAVAVLVGLAGSISAQTVGDSRIDPGTGDYLVTVLNDLRQPVDLRVVPPNKVVLSVEVRMEAGELRPFRYVYRVRVHEDTPQPLKFVEIDCPVGTTMERLSAGALLSGVSTTWRAEQIRSSRRPRCDIDYRGAPLPGGGTLEAALETGLLPAIGELRAFGATPGVNWPTSDPIAENEPARAVVAQLDGTDGGWRPVTAPVPGRDPASISAPALGLAALQSDLGRACGSLSWIVNASVCASLTGLVQQTIQSVAGNDYQDAHTTLQGFLTQLSEQHDSAGTLPVNDKAFWLLKTIAQFILSHLGQPTTPMCFGAAATIYVQNGVIVGGPHNGQTYAGTLDGTAGNDVIVGTGARDIVEAGSGADKVCGLGGDDLIKGQGDPDQLDGGDGNDAIEGGAGNDVIVGSGGNDLLKGQDGNDTITGGEGNDTMEGGPGDDDLDGGPGTDTLKGQGGTDRCRQGETVETCETS